MLLPLPNILQLEGYRVAMVRFVAPAPDDLDSWLVKDFLPDSEQREVWARKSWHVWSRKYVAARKIVPITTALTLVTKGLSGEEQSVMEMLRQGQSMLWDVPIATQEGDCVVAVLGGYTPLVIRPVPGKATYEYIGPGLLGELNEVCPGQDSITGSQINVILSKELEARQRSDDLQSFDLQ